MLIILRLPKYLLTPRGEYCQVGHLFSQYRPPPISTLFLLFHYYCTTINTPDHDGLVFLIFFIQFYSKVTSTNVSQKQIKIECHD